MSDVIDDMVDAHDERIREIIQRLEAEKAHLRAVLGRIVNEPYPSTRAGRSRILRQAKEALEPTTQRQQRAEAAERLRPRAFPSDYED